MVTPETDGTAAREAGTANAAAKKRKEIADVFMGEEVREVEGRIVPPAEDRRRKAR